MRSFIIILTIAILAGCTVPVTITSYSVSPAMQHDLSSFVGDSRAKQIAAASSEGFLIVRLTTQEDLVSLSKQKSLIIDAKVRFCDERSGRYEINVPGLSTNGQSILEWHMNDPATRIPSRSMHEYDVLLFVVLKENEFAKPHAPSSSHAGHDLRSQPRDICISISGGNLETTMISNEIRIGAEKIRRMLEKQ